MRQHCDDGEILKRVKKGLILDDVLIVDAHGHIGPCHNFHIPENDAKGLIRTMDSIGIDKVCISAVASIGPDYQLGNNLVAKAIKSYPGRFIGYTTINPNYLEDIETELKRCCEGLKMRAIKIHPSSHNYPVDGPNYQLVWEYAERKGYPVLSHTCGGEEVDTPRMFDSLAKKYPNVNFIIGHSGLNFKGVEESIEVARKRKNVYLDLCYISMYFGIVEYLVGKVGAEKLLYGSDIPWHSAQYQLGNVLLAKISDKDKQKILGLNIANLLGV